MIGNRLLYFITGFLHCRLINKKNGDQYLERYFINSRIYLHRFVSPDVDQDIHDHPWSWVISFILLGQYLEQLRYGQPKMCKWFNFFGPNHFHRIIMAEPKTWILFIVGKKIKSWGGFWTTMVIIKKCRASPVSSHIKIILKVHYLDVLHHDNQ